MYVACFDVAQTSESNLAVQPPNVVDMLPLEYRHFQLDFPNQSKLKLYSRDAKGRNSLQKVQRHKTPDQLNGLPLTLISCSDRIYRRLRIQLW